MDVTVRDRVAGAVLLLVALVWCGLVYWTIPPGQGGLVGPRAFPLVFGLALGALSLALLAKSVLGRTSRGEDDKAPLVYPGETFSVIATVVAIVAYGFLLQPLGFIPATVLIVAAIMIVILRIRNMLAVAAMAVGLAIGCYVVFGKLLGTYLPPGTWITVTF